MKQIEELLKEYSIRFNVAEKIKEEGYPFAPLSYRINRDRATPDVRDGYLCNEQGIVYENGVWATADVKEKPEKWVVEKDEGNPLWEKFKEWFGFNLKDNGLFGFRYIGRGSPRLISNDLLYFENHQYLTLDQWAELFLPKEEFSNGQIVHEDGRIMIMKGDGRKFHVLYCPYGEDFSFMRGLIIDSVYAPHVDESLLCFRPATKEEKQTLFTCLEEVGKKWNPKTLQIEDLVDFSILNDKDWLYLEVGKAKRPWLAKGDILGENNIAYSINTQTLHLSNHPICEKDHIKTLRKATSEDLASMFEKHPELAPPKEGDWGVFWNVEYKTPDKIMRLEKIETVHVFSKYVKQFVAADGLFYDNFAKINLNKPLQPQIDKLIKQINDPI